MKLFWKIYCVVLAAFVGVVALSSYVTSTKRISEVEKSIVEENRIIGSLISNEIEQRQLESKWPFKSLKRLTEHRDFIFWWIVGKTDVIYLADKASFIGSRPSDYFPQLTGIFPDGDVLLNRQKKYGLFIKTFKAGNDRWSFWFGFSTKAVSSERARIISTTVIYSVAASLLLGFVLYLLINHFLSPIENLAAGAERIGKGDLNHKVEVKSNDELGYLAHSFNKMAEDLKTTTTSIDNLNNEIAERKSAEVALRESEKRFKQVAECTGEWIWEVNTEGLYTYTSPVVEKILGYKPEEIVGKKYFYDFFDPDVKNELKRAAFEVFSRKQSFVNFVNPNVHKNGSIVVIETSGMPIFDNAGNLIGYRGLDTDITERKQGEEKIKLFSDAIAGAFDCFMLTDIKGNITYGNESVMRSFGYTAEEFLNLNVTKLDADPEVAKKISQEILVKGKWSGEVVNIRKNGEKFHTLLSAFIIKDDKGNPKGTMGILRDITDRKNVETALRKSEERFRQVVENAGDWIWEVDVEGLYTYTNPIVERVLGYKPEEIVGKKHFYDFFAPEVKEKLKKAAFELFAKRKSFKGFVNPNVHKNGGTVILEAAAAPIVDEEGNFCGYRGADRDISERKKREKELREAHEKLVLASRKAGMAEVAADVLHNVGNVLNSINVSTTLMTEKVTNSEVANLEKVARIINEHLNEIGPFLTEHPQGKHIPVYLTEVGKCLQAEQADIISKLQVLTDNVQHIKDIISMQQSYAKVSGLEVQVSLSQLIEDAIQINSAGLQRHGTRLMREFDELPDVEIDKQKVLQILVNLISNAKYALSNSKKEEKIVTVRLYKHQEGRLRIEVTDNGVGISRNNLSKIFSHGFTTKQNGHGFGLHSSALAAKEMGGSLTVHSDGVGQGATFTLELPFKPTKAVL